MTTDHDFEVDAHAVATSWFEAFNDALARADRDALDALFLDECYIRDLVAFTWNFRQESQKGRGIDLIAAGADGTHARNFRVDETKPASPAVVGEDPTVVEAFLAFEVDAGHGDGIVYLVEDPGSPVGFRSRNLLTRLTGLREHTPEWPRWDRFDETHPGTRWTDHRDRQAGFDDREPEVLIVGGGQFGVMTAASLNRLGVDNLVVDKNGEAGGGWRSRYESLLLHQPHGMLHFPYMPFPESFPEYVPKDKLADWFKAYVDAMDINLWTSAEFLGGTFDDASETWHVRVRCADGGIRELRPKHVVIATGGTEKPRIPDIAGLPRFQGEVVHSSRFTSGDDYVGKNVLVVGVGTSGHDVALDVTERGGHATILQRGPAIVVEIETANLMYGDYNARVVPTELVDIRFLAGLVYPQLKQSFIAGTTAGDEADKTLHVALEAAGMDVHSGYEGAGFFYEYFKKGGGYYLNVGASERIIDGDIGVLRINDVDRFLEHGLRLTDGSERPVDAVVLATGYQGISVALTDYFGEEVAEKVGPVWGFGTDGEINNTWKPTGQKGLWIELGAIPQARWYAPLVAIQIQAHLNHLVPETFLSPGHPSRTPQEQVVQI